MARNPLRIVPLGGLGEVGKNMMALEYDRDIIVVDCGILFPEEDMPGVDLVLPDITYLLERKDRVRGILITHGHEDHTGALPFVLPSLDVPVYAPRLAHGLISVKLRERAGNRDAKIVVAEPGKPVKLGKFSVEFFRVCHSIPDAMGLAISTPQGMVIHTGDFKIDHTPVDGLPTDLAQIASYAGKGALLLLSDSTYAEVPGYTPSEQVVGDALDRAIGEAPGRVLVATFASLISRIQQVIDAAYNHGRKVCVVGRSMVENVKMSVQMGYLNAPPGVLLPLGETRNLPAEELVLITTGSQGEPTSALVRIANRDHRDIRIKRGDTVIISATPIPGNETVVTRTIDNLFRQGARVLYDRVALVHVHGHAAQEELKTMLNLVKPKFFVPVHGEFHHLVAHAALAKSMGVEESNIFILEDGDVLDIDGDKGEIVGSTPAGHVYVDGRNRLAEGSRVIRDRKALSRDGVVVVALALDKHTLMPVRPPEIVAKGFMEGEEMEEVFSRVSASLAESLSNGSGPADWDGIDERVREIVTRLLVKETGRSPIVTPVALEV